MTQQAKVKKYINILNTSPNTNLSWQCGYVRALLDTHTIDHEVYNELTIWIYNH